MYKKVKMSIYLREEICKIFFLSLNDSAVMEIVFKN